MQLRETVEAILNDVTLKEEDADLKECDKQMAYFEENDLNELYLALLTIYKENHNIPVRRFILTYWENKLIFGEGKEKGTWVLITNEARDIFKHGLIELFGMETDASLREKICSVIVTVIAGFEIYNDETDPQISADATEWPEIYVFFDKLAESELESDNAGLYFILGQCFQSACMLNEIGPQKLFDWVKKGLESPFVKVQLEAIYAVLSILTNEGCDYSKPAMQVFPSVLHKFKSLISENSDLNHTLIRILEVYTEIPIKIIRKHLHELFATVKEFVDMSDITMANLNDRALALLTDFAQLVPNTLKKKIDLVKEYIELNYLQMSLITEDVTEEWACPDSLSEDEESSQEERLKMSILNNINILCSNLGYEFLKKAIETEVTPKLASSDWKQAYFALMFLSQLGEYLTIDEAMPMLELLVVNQLKSANSKVRYAAIHCMGQFCDDLSTEFDESEVKKLIKYLLETLEHETVSRLTTHILASIQNLLREETNPEVLIYFGVEKLLHMGKKYALEGVPIVREAGVEFLGVLAMILKDRLNGYVGHIFEAVFMLFAYTKTDFKTLRGYTLEAASNVLAEVPDAAKYTDKIIEFAIETLEDHVTFDESTERLKIFVVDTFFRLSMTFKSNVDKYIPQIIPGLIKLAENILMPRGKEGSVSLTLKAIKDELLYLKTDDDENEGASEFSKEEICVAIESLNSFMDCSPSDLVVYIPNFDELYTNSLQIIENPLILKSLLQATVTFLEFVQKNTTPEDFEKMFTKFRGLVMKKISNIDEYGDEFCEIIEILGELFKISENYLSLEEATSTLKFMEELVQQLQRENMMLEASLKKNDEEPEQDEEGFDLEDEATTKDQIETIELTQVELTKALEELIKANPEIFTNDLGQNVIDLFKTRHWNYSYAIKSACRLENALVAASVVIEVFHPDHPLVSPLLDKTIIRILEFSSINQRVRLRLITSTTVGAFARYASKETFKLYAGRLLAILEKLPTPKAEKGKKELQLIDHITKSYGEIIKYQEGAIMDDIILKWLNNIPLQKDKTSTDQYELFADLIVESKIEMFCGENTSRKQMVAYKIGLVRELTEKIKDDSVRRKIENAYLKVMKLDN